MACLKCKADNVSDNYKCHPCIIEDKDYNWCVITEVDESGTGNLADSTIIFKRQAVIDYIRNESFSQFNIKDWKKYRSRFFKDEKDYYMHVKREVFTLGEMFIVDPYFEREMTGNGRAPRKWYVEYKIFSSRNLKQALELATKVRNE